MTFAHPLVGLILGKYFGHATAFVVGSMFPDIDHLFVLIKNKHFKPAEIFERMKNEKKYNETYKTPYTHSILALIIMSTFVILINKEIGIAFSIGYTTHIILDAIDTDEKQLFFPIKKKIKGFLPIFSYIEIISAIILGVIYFI